MKMQGKKLFLSYLVVVMALVVSGNAVLADDLNPPPYRGDPLSVYAHWSADASGQLIHDGFVWVDDNDPSTSLYPQPPLPPSAPPGGAYDFFIPNFIDELPLKLLRLQLTWEGTTQPPLFVDAFGEDSGQAVAGLVTFASSPLIFTQPDGGYQYFDFEFRPNPDCEWLHVQLAPDAYLVQVVVDSISIIPEPATLGLLALGGLVLVKKKRTI